MEGRLRGRATIITGGWRGIGRASALAFAREGARVCVNYPGEGEAESRRLVKEIRGLGGAAIAVRADVGKRSEVRRLVSETVGEFGGVDVLVNNAAILLRADIISMDEDQLDSMIRVNLKGTINCVREAIPHMRKRRDGRIVNVSSIAGMGVATPLSTPYAVTKGGIISLTKRLALELGKFGISVNCVAPGYVRTDMVTSGLKSREIESLEKRMTRNTMLQRIGRPEDVANAILFLASDESSFITGQVLSVDGGRTDFLSRSC